MNEELCTSGNASFIFSIVSEALIDQGNVSHFVLFLGGNQSLVQPFRNGHKVAIKIWSTLQIVMAQITQTIHFPPLVTVFSYAEEGLREGGRKSERPCFPVTKEEVALSTKHQA